MLLSSLLTKSLAVKVVLGVAGISATGVGVDAETGSLRPRARGASTPTAHGSSVRRRRFRARRSRPGTRTGRLRIPVAIRAGRTGTVPAPPRRRRRPGTTPVTVPGTIRGTAPVTGRVDTGSTDRHGSADRHVPAPDDLAGVLVPERA